MRDLHPDSSFVPRSQSFPLMSGIAQLALRPDVHHNLNLNQEPEVGGDGLNVIKIGHGRRTTTPMSTMFILPSTGQMMINFVTGWEMDGLTGHFVSVSDPGECIGTGGCLPI